MNPPELITPTAEIAAPPPWRLRLVSVLQIIGVLATFLGMADFLNLLSVMPKTDFAKWLIVSGPTLATSAKPLIVLFGDILDNGVRDDSFKLPVALLLVASIGLAGLTGCAGFAVGIETRYGSAEAPGDGSLVLRPKLPARITIQRHSGK